MSATAFPRGHESGLRNRPRPSPPRPGIVGAGFNRGPYLSPRHPPHRVSPSLAPPSLKSRAKWRLGRLSGSRSSQAQRLRISSGGGRSAAELCLEALSMIEGCVCSSKKRRSKTGGIRLLLGDEAQPEGGGAHTAPRPPSIPDRLGPPVRQSGDRTKLRWMVKIKEGRGNSLIWCNKNNLLFRTLSVI